MLKNDKMHKNNILNKYALPTGALDQNSGKEVLKLFHRLNEMGNTIVMITHDLSVARNAQRILRIVDGVLYEDAGA